MILMKTIVAPFEWDLQRLVASILIASQSFKYVESVGYKAIEKLLTSYLDGLEAHCKACHPYKCGMKNRHP